MPYIIWSKCGAFWFSPPVGKSLNIVEKVEGLSLVAASFAPRDSPTPWKNKTCHVTSLPLVSIMPNIHPLTRYCERSSWGRECRAFNVNQPVVLVRSSAFRALSPTHDSFPSALSRVSLGSQHTKRLFIGRKIPRHHELFIAHCIALHWVLHTKCLFYRP